MEASNLLPLARVGMPVHAHDPAGQQVTRTAQHGITGTQEQGWADEIILRRPNDEIPVAMDIGQQPLQLEKGREILNPDDGTCQQL